MKERLEQTVEREEEREQEKGGGKIRGEKKLVEEEGDGSWWKRGRI